MIGRYMRQKAVESISIRSLQAQKATITCINGTQNQADTRLLQYGDVFKVFPESRIPTDETVILESLEVDKSIITGKSTSVEKEKDSSVIAGSMNGSGVLTIGLIEYLMTTLLARSHA